MTSVYNNKISRFSLSVGCAVLIWTAVSAQNLAPGLADRVGSLTETGSDSLVSVVVFMENQLADVIARAAENPLMRRQARIKSVVSGLKKSRVPHADQVAVFLEKNSSTPVTRYWIVPAFTATVPLSTIETLAKLDGIKRVVENVPLNYEPPVEVSPAPSLSTSVSDELGLLNVPSLWQRGLRGAGRLVCSFDTGVELSHPALSSKWRGNHATLNATWFSKVAPDTVPYDRVGHGTHTMGIMVGAAEADSFGVAPQAEWISAGVIDQGRPLETTLSDIIEAFQWALNPDDDTSTTDDVPDVILNSWGIPKGLFSPCDDTFGDVIEAVEAAGIVTVFAAGNEGRDGPVTLRSPADQATSAINTFSVGAVDDSKVIAEFSSRGPSSCDNSQIKPEVVAPGVGVRSSKNDGGYSCMSGTSMAAPYIAGLVALMRQYNPDATVAQIKNALMLAAADLGPTGEDNTYGHGLVDASQLLQHLPLPAAAEFNLAHTLISDDGIALPGETFGLSLVLNNPAGNVETVIGTVTVEPDQGASVVEDEADFSFGIGGTTATNSFPFQITFDSSLYHGQTVSFALSLWLPGGSTFDTLDFELEAGIAPGGSVAAHNTSLIDFSVSDFGQYGFGQGSIYNVGGEGFRYKGSSNLMYEAGLILGRNPLQLSNSIRDSAGQFSSSDFAPVELLSESVMGDDGGVHSHASYVDNRSEIPIPITIAQEVISYDEDGDLLILKYYLENHSLERLTGLYFGFLADFDIACDGDEIVYDNVASLIYQRGESGPAVGLVALRNISSFKSIDNGAAKIGFMRTEKFDLISEGGVDVDRTRSGDLLFVVSSREFTMDPFDSVTVAFALVAADDVSSLYDVAARAKERYDLSTSVCDNSDGTRPETALLHQNYPNPFNPVTTISFSLPTAGEVSLDIYNTLGQRVRNLYSGCLPSGEYSFLWNGTSNHDRPVASGIYFYRLRAGETSYSKKMLLLK